MKKVIAVLVLALVATIASNTTLADDQHIYQPCTTDGLTYMLSAYRAGGISLVYLNWWKAECNFTEVDA